MGYGDGAMELMKAHMTLSKLYESRGGAEINKRIVTERRVTNEALCFLAESSTWY